MPKVFLFSRFQDLIKKHFGKENVGETKLEQTPALTELHRQLEHYEQLGNELNALHQGLKNSFSNELSQLQFSAETRSGIPKWNSAFEVLITAIRGKQIVHAECIYKGKPCLFIVATKGSWKLQDIKSRRVLKILPALSKGKRDKLIVFGEKRAAFVALRKKVGKKLAALNT